MVRFAAFWGEIQHIHKGGIHLKFLKRSLVNTDTAGKIAGFRRIVNDFLISYVNGEVLL